MSRRRSHAQLRNISQLDVTPLVDLTFLLLIVFMITAPALEYAADVTPPGLNAAPVTDAPHVINLTRDGRYVVAQETIAAADLDGYLRRLRQREPDTRLFVRADGTRPYAEVIGLMRVARRAGFDEVKLLTREEGP